MDNTLVYAVIVILILGVLYWGYTNCKLDRYLPHEYQKCKTSPYMPISSGFVGSMGKSPPYVPCAFPESADWAMNRCNYM